MALRSYKIPNILPANEPLLAADIYLIVINAAQIPPHLAVSINGKLFTLTVKGAMVDGELAPLLQLIKKKSIETIFIKLAIPQLFTMDQLREEIKKHTLAYPRVDVSIATCLNPIKDFCSSVYETETKNINFLFDLLPQLYQQNIINSCYQMNLDKYLSNNAFYLNKYTMSDIYEGIRNAQLVPVN